jgi:hypothetical protein
VDKKYIQATKNKKLPKTKNQKPKTKKKTPPITSNRRTQANTKAKTIKTHKSSSLSDGLYPFAGWSPTGKEITI